MLHLACALFILCPPLAQDEPPQPPQREDLHKPEEEVLKKIDETERALRETDNAKRRAELEAQLRRLRRHLEELRHPQPPPLPGRDMDEHLRMLDEIKEYAREFEPEAFRRLQRFLEHARTEEAHPMLNDLRRRMQELREMRQRHPDEFERRQKIAAAEREAWDLADRFRKAEGEERGRLKEQLAGALSKVFDMREEARGRELAELEGRVMELRETLAKRRENKAKIVEKRAQEMLGEEYEW
ncbi:MAG: hypothetical protein HYY16_15600 [Planctomycetes bacterium]|nr:hypothetical protein [Planctomycetota bacterium]